jgi:hypothetical protein
MPDPYAEVIEAAQRRLVETLRKVHAAQEQAQNARRAMERASNAELAERLRREVAIHELAVHRHEEEAMQQQRHLSDLKEMRRSSS